MDCKEEGLNMLTMEHFAVIIAFLELISIGFLIGYCLKNKIHKIIDALRIRI